MIKLLCTVLFMTFIGEAQSQHKQSYQELTKAFISVTRVGNGYALLNKPNAYGPGCLNELKADKFYTKEEIRFIERSLKKPPINLWTKKLIPNARILTEKALEARRKLGYRSYHLYAAPIFIRKGSYCLFYNGDSFGGPFGSGRMRLYYKFGSHWVVIKSYCIWLV